MLSLFVALSLSTTPAVAAPLPEEPPAVFARSTFEEARTAAVAEGKLLVLDAMTSWCGPCKKMDMTTWIDPDLVAWMGANCVAVQLDMDLHTELKDELKITAFPTIIAFDDAGEADRIVGYRDAKGMGDWLALVRSGSTELDKVMAEIEARTWTNSPEDLGRRVHYARELYYLAGYAEARSLVFDVWNAAPAAGFDRANLRGLLGDLARADSDSVASIEDLRRAGSSAGAPSILAADSAALADWITLSVALGDSAGLEAWALGRNARGQGDVVRSFGRVLYPLLLRDGCWRAAGVALVDPIADFERSGSRLKQFDNFDGGAMGMTPAKPIANGGGMTLAKPITPEMRAELAAAEAAEAAAEEESAPEDPAEASAPKVVPGVPMTGTAPVAPAQSGEPRTGTPEVGAAKAVSIPAMPMIGAGGMAGADSDDTGAKIRSQYRWDASHAYAALLAADRTDEAVALGELVLRHEDSPKARVAMVCRALEAGQGDARRAVHVAWLAAASNSDLK